VEILNDKKWIPLICINVCVEIIGGEGNTVGYSAGRKKQRRRDGEEPKRFGKIVEPLGGLDEGKLRVGGQSF